MSKIKQPHFFTSESVSAGHPDKVCDAVSDAILDAHLEKDSMAKVACETMVSTDFVANTGEIKTSYNGEIDYEQIARKVVEDIGYDKEEYMFFHNTFEYINKLHSQSEDIAIGVEDGKGLHKEQGAGDQGIMFGYASNETSDYMPAPIYYSHKLLQYFDEQRKSKAIPYLRPDAKSQISIFYEDGKPQYINSIVLSHQTDDLEYDKIFNDIKSSIEKFFEGNELFEKKKNEIQYFINPTGKFVIGGPHGDAGLTGRKIIVDTYGGVGNHGGGAFSGKDPSKVDRSACYYARYAAKNIVAAGLADKCEIQISYAIGFPEPVSINISAYGTEKVSLEKLNEIVHNEDIFNFRPRNIVDELSLRNPSGWNYLQTSSYGHFGRDIFPWEQLNKVEKLKSYL